MRVGIVYDRFGDAAPPRDAPPDWDAEYEPEETIAALEGALRRLGHEPVRIGNARALLAEVGRGSLDIDAAVTIAESYGSRNREAHAPVLLELAGIPTFGSDALALSVSLDKHLTKVVARATGVATPDWRVVPAPDAAGDGQEMRLLPPAGGGREGGEAHPALCLTDQPPLPPPVQEGDSIGLPFPVFVKPRYEGTAKGIAPSSRCQTPEALDAEVRRQLALYDQDLLVERFVEGTEFTVGIVGTGDDAEALPVLQRAVERETGIGLHALERHEPPDAPFDYDVEGVLTPDLEAELQAAALAVHRALECRDVSRSDVRVDADGGVWFIEINTLPTFAPDGTFAILADLLGEDYEAWLADVLARGFARMGLAPAPRSPHESVP